MTRTGFANMLVRSNSRRRMLQKKKSDSTVDTTTTSLDKPKVSFGTVRIHTHKVTLGSNPSVSSGVPMELQWDHIESENFKIEEYEAMTDGAEKKGPTRVSRADRERMLSENGHSRSSFSKCYREIQKVKEDRRQTVRLVKQERLRQLNAERERAAQEDAVNAIAEILNGETISEDESKDDDTKVKIDGKKDPIEEMSRYLEAPQGKEIVMLQKREQELATPRSPTKRLARRFPLKKTKSDPTLAASSLDKSSRRVFGIKVFPKSTRLQV